MTNRIPQDMPQHMNVIGGGRVAASRAARTIRSSNPARPRECLGEFADSTQADVGPRRRRGGSGGADVGRHTGPQRGALLFRFAELLEASKSELARIVTLEQGKALAEAMGEVGRAAAEARFMAGEASRPIGLTFPSERAGFILLHDRPSRSGSSRPSVPGIFPSSRRSARSRRRSPGATPSSSSRPSLTPWSAVYLMHLLERAGVPPGVVNLVTGPAARGGDALFRTPASAGSPSRDRPVVGTRVYEAAARRLARVQLELGGKNPAVVVDCDDLDNAARELSRRPFCAAASGARPSAG